MLKKYWYYYLAAILGVTGCAANIAALASPNVRGMDFFNHALLVVMCAWIVYRSSEDIKVDMQREHQYQMREMYLDKLRSLALSIGAIKTSEVVKKDTNDA